MKTGLPPKKTSSSGFTPDKTAVPVAVAAVVPSYILLLPVNPVTVSSLVKVMGQADSLRLLKPTELLVSQLSELCNIFRNSSLQPLTSSPAFSQLN